MRKLIRRKARKGSNTSICFLSFMRERMNKKPPKLSIPKACEATHSIDPFYHLLWLSNFGFKVRGEREAMAYTINISRKNERDLDNGNIYLTRKGRESTETKTKEKSENDGAERKKWKRRSVRWKEMMPLTTTHLTLHHSRRIYPPRDESWK